MSKPTLQGRLAVITGAARGIGRSVATAFAEAGASLVLADIDEASLATTTKKLRTDGADVTEVVTDVGDTASRTHLTQQVLAIGTPTIVVPAAGVQHRSAPEDLSDADLERLWLVNVAGTIGVVRRLLPAMRAAGYGKIVTVGSLGTLRGLERRSGYAATKGAVGQFTMSLASEVGVDGIRVNSVAPGYVETDMTSAWLHDDPERTTALTSRIPLGRFATPEDLTGTFVFLAAPASDYITGQVIVVDGGWTTT